MAPGQLDVLSGPADAMICTRCCESEQHHGCLGQTTKKQNRGPSWQQRQVRHHHAATFDLKHESNCRGITI
jgi:hypothetical protein